MKPIVSVTLEEVLEYIQEDEIIIKIDVEGYECKVLALNHIYFIGRLFDVKERIYWYSKLGLTDNRFAIKGLLVRRMFAIFDDHISMHSKE